ncbi:MAG: alpha/beta hydrolase [Lactobacillus sp.]|jgi:uncharacterized alpha/beta hydrolase family protein|nr:alpha/beta hydrolase [Lactobacillus sp.]
MTKKHKFLRFLGVLLLALLILLPIWQSHQMSYTDDIQVPQSKTATVFVPGYRGNWISFGGMIYRLNHQGIATKALVAHVAKDGQVTFDQKAKVADNNPMVQVLFKDNTQEHKQAKQLQGVLRALKTKYHITQVNLVGHSTGGNIVFDYLTNPKLRDSNVPTTVKFVNIATTFPGDAKKGKYLPKNLQVLNIAGNIWHAGTDGGVPLKQDLALGDIVRPYVARYQEQIVEGSPLTVYHSLLHENGRVDLIISDFLFRIDKF